MNMKTSELMMGDWVRYHSKLIKVTSLYAKPTKEGDFVSNEVGWSYDVSTWVDGDFIEPIPLTSEILERNGFKKYEEDYHNEYVCEKCDETSYYEIVICWKDSYDNGALDAFNHVQWDEGWKLDIVSDGSYNKGWCKTIYLHELQHALRLCGLNELADNLKLE